MRIAALFSLALVVPGTALATETINLAAGGTGASVRAPGHVDSWIALIILVSSFVTAWCMNFSAPRVRAFGTALAASGCLAVAAWFFFFVMGTGFLENPKPNQTPMDSAKPALLWIQACVALGSGLFLLGIAWRQRNDQETLVLAAENEGQRYGSRSRFLHWTTAILFLALIPMGIFTSIIPEGTAFRNAYYVVHKTLGLVVFALLIVRLFWNRKSQRPALSDSLKPTSLSFAAAASLMKALGTPLMEAYNSTCSRPVRFAKWASNWGQYPIRRRVFCGS